MTSSDERYGKIQVIIHWLTLLLLLGSFFSHEAMKAAWRFVGENGAEGFTPDIGVRVHVIIGISILVLTVIRIVLKVTKGSPPPVEGQHPVITIAASAVHGLLYLILLAMPLTGMAAWLGGIRDLGEVHKVLFIVILVLLAAHILAALFHQFIIKDNLISRMRLK